MTLRWIGGAEHDENTHFPDEPDFIQGVQVLKETHRKAISAT